MTRETGFVYTHAVKNPRRVGFAIELGCTVAENEAMFRIWPNIPWLSSVFYQYRFRLSKKTTLTAIDEAAQRGEYRDSENPEVREQTLDSRRPSELGTSLGQSVLAWTSCCNHFALTERPG